MGQFIDLTAKDGLSFPAYVAEPAGKPRGAVVVVQEIFGVNSHIRSCLLYTSPSPRDGLLSRMPSSA